MRHSKLVTLALCALTSALAACGDDISLGANNGAADGSVADSSAAQDGGSCGTDAGPVVLQCGNITCNGQTEYCSSGTWPGPCKPLPCACNAVSASAQSCACLLQNITPDCDAGTAKCTNTQSGLVISCN